MSYTASLTDQYGDVFLRWGLFSVSPYTATFFNVAGRDQGLGLNGIVSGFFVCAALTVVPVLPLFTLITMSLAIVAAFVGAVSALLLYPVALVLDATSDCGSTNFSSVDFN